jgi:ActR/RegA family two-component response regulator
VCEADILLAIGPAVGNQASGQLVAYNNLPYALARDKIMEDWEKQYIEAALKENDGNISQTARKLDMHRQRLHEIINKYRGQVGEVVQ